MGESEEITNKKIIDEETVKKAEKRLRIDEALVERYVERARKEGPQFLLGLLERDHPRPKAEAAKALAILKAGGEKAKKIASKKMKEIKEKIGVNVY